jgi:hypothetical protein
MRRSILSPLGMNPQFPQVIYNLASGTPVTTAPDTTPRTIVCPTLSLSTPGNFYNTSTGEFTAPFSGFYECIGSANISGTTVAGDYIFMAIYVNGTVIRTISGNRFETAALQNISHDGQGHVRAGAGDLITLRVATNATLTSWNNSTEGNGVAFRYVGAYFGT